MASRSIAQLSSEINQTTIVKDSNHLRWLLEEDQPSVRYLALTELLDRSESDAEVSEARRSIPLRGWAAQILAKQAPGGWWVGKESLYKPKYVSTNWMLLALSDMGLNKDNPMIAMACKIWMDRYSKEDGGFGSDGAERSHLCVVGNTARALVKFGYADKPRVQRAFEWMVRNSSELGGWNCFGSGRNLDSWEPMSAFAVYPKQKWTRGMKEAVEKGAEYYLERGLHKQGAKYNPWYRFHYPVHYYYDLLVALDFMTALGYGTDKRLGHALGVLRKRRRPDGRWNLDGVHPDVEGGMKEWFEAHPKQKPTPFALESAGKASKMITLRALRVLKRIGEE